MRGWRSSPARQNSDKAAALEVDGDGVPVVQEVFGGVDDAGMSPAWSRA
jgi:hypothetical protein